MSRLSIVLPLLLLPTWSCEPPHIEDYAPGNQPASSSGGPREAELLLAEVDGEPISLADFQRQMGRLSDSAQSRLDGDRGRRGFLEALIATHLMAEAARREGWGNDPAVQWAEEQALIEVVRERAVRSQDRDAPLGEAEVEASYEINAFRFDRPESRWIAVLVIDDPERAEQVADRYRARYATDVGASIALFDELLASEASGLRQPGDLGFVARSDLEAVTSDGFVEAVMTLRNNGDLAGPLAVAGGWALIQLREAREAIERPLDSVEGELREQIRRDRRHWMRERVTAEWRAAATIEVDRALLQQLGEAWAGREQAAAPAPWESEPDFVLDERLTPVVDLTMLGGLLGPSPAPERAPDAPASAPSEGAQGD